MGAESDQPKRAMESTPTLSLAFIQYFRAASLAFFIYEIALTLDQEVELVWPRSNKNWFKWHYLFTRYFALAASITNRAIDHFSINSPGLMSTSLRRWISCQVVIGSALILSVEMQFMVRVYVLYRCSTRMVLALLFLILCEIVFAIVGLALKSDIGIHPNNVALLSPDSFIYFGASIVQVIVLTLTIHKYKSLATAPITATGVVSRILKDEIFGFVVILFVTTWTWLSAITNLSAAISDSWLLVIVSCVGCRLVLGCSSNLKKLPEFNTVLSSPCITTYADSFTSSEFRGEAP